MAKKILLDEFLQRFYKVYDEADIVVLNYTAISKPAIIQCNKCKKIYKYTRAREALNNYNCCLNNITKIQRLIQLYNGNKEFDFIKQVDKDHFIVRHNKCCNEIKRVIQGSLDNPFTCKYCEDIKYNNLLSIQEIQQRLNERFFNEIQILDYNGQLKENHYKCLKCGLIFTQKQACLMQSRGCPKCDRFKSYGEKQIRDLLMKYNIRFKEQVAIQELPLQHFDFGVYDDNDHLLYFIEVQGEQHFEKRGIFRDSLEIIQKRDEKKRLYCKNSNIPLYELIYRKGKILNLDILPI